VKCLFTCLPHAPLATQVFEDLNDELATGINTFLDKVEPFQTAVAKVSEIGDDLKDVISVAKTVVDNEVFKTVVAGLKAFEDAITTRVKFTINLGTWEIFGVRAACFIYCGTCSPIHSSIHGFNSQWSLCQHVHGLGQAGVWSCEHGPVTCRCSVHRQTKL
jgi:hypothetical protein